MIAEPLPEVPNSFRAGESTVRITNRPPRAHTRGFIAVAVFLILGPAARMVGFDWGVSIEGPLGMSLYGLGLLICLSGVWWWSTITIDESSREILVSGRWGIFSWGRLRALDAFDGVRLVPGAVGDTEVVMTGSRYLTVAWGHDPTETSAIACCLAARLGLPIQTESSIAVSEPRSSRHPLPAR